MRFHRFFLFCNEVRGVTGKYFCGDYSVESLREEWTFSVKLSLSPPAADLSVFYVTNPYNITLCNENSLRGCSCTIYIPTYSAATMVYFSWLPTDALEKLRHQISMIGIMELRYTLNFMLCVRSWGSIIWGIVDRNIPASPAYTMYNSAVTIDSLIDTWYISREDSSATID